MPHASSIVLTSAPGLALLALLPLQAVAQTPEYELTRLGTVDGAYITAATGMNDHGEVVGFAQFTSGEPAIRAWHWTEAQGLVVLPIPTGIFLDRYAAQDINNSGVIAGDGGGDAGEAWRYMNGTYELLGVPPGYGTTTAEGINEAGVITGTSKSSQITTPKQAFVAAPGQPMSVIASEAYARSINDVGQVVGEGAPILPGGGPGGYRYTPGVGIISFGPVAGRAAIHATSVNALGATVGDATSASGGLRIPFLYTDEGGMQAITDFESHSGASWINDLGQVVGWREQSGTDGWIWTEQDGLRFLDTLYEGWENDSLTGIHRINNAGQILVTVYNQTTFGFEPALLTPCCEPLGTVYCDPGIPNSSGSPGEMTLTGSDVVRDDELTLTATSLPTSSNIGYFIMGTGINTFTPPGSVGPICVAPGIKRFLGPVNNTSELRGGFSRVVGTSGPVSSNITPGSVWNFQAWHRDSMAGTSNLTNAVSVTFQ